MKAAISQSIAYGNSLLVHPTIRSDQNVTIFSLYKVPQRNTMLEPILHHYNPCFAQIKISKKYFHMRRPGRNTSECRQ